MVVQNVCADSLLTFCTACNGQLATGVAGLVARLL